jgi:3-oxoisoapionate decarboxylase
MILGIGSYTFGWAVGVPGQIPPEPLDETGLLQKANQAGVKLVQIGDNLPLHTFGNERLEQLSRNARAQDIGLQVGARRLTTERVREYCQICRRLNADLLRFVIDDADYRPNRETVLAVLKECAPLLKEITLAIENHDRFPAATLRDLIEKGGNKQIGVCLDTANSLGAGEGLHEVVQALGPVTVNLHIKDFHVERVPYLMGFSVSGCPAGRGMMNLPWLLDQLARHGQCESAILEQWTPPEQNLADTIAKEAAWASQSLDYLKSFFAETPL